MRNRPVKYVVNTRLDPHFNLALEELLLAKDEPDDFVVLWRNPPTVVVGRHQIVRDEVDVCAARARNVEIVRRMTGGGAVFHDEGNVNYSFVVNGSADVARYVERVASALRQLGPDAVVSGRNDILVDGLKVSGFATCSHRGRTLCHGTLLFDSDLETMNTLLAAGKTKYHATKVASVTARVKNLRELLPSLHSAEDFMSAIAPHLVGSDAEEYRLCDEDLDAIQSLVTTKYANPEWNKIEERRFDQRYERQYPWGKIGIGFRLSEGLIVESRMYGDVLVDGGLDRIATCFVGRRFSAEELVSAIQDADFDGIPVLDQATLLELLELS